MQTEPTVGRAAPLAAGLVLILGLIVPGSGTESHQRMDRSMVERDRTLPIGDTLTVIQRPLINIPALVTSGDVLTIECDAGPGTTGWAAELIHDQVHVPLGILSSTYDASTLWWTLSAQVPSVSLHELYDLRVTADGGIEDVTWDAVHVIPEFKDDYYFILVTDPHLPTHLYNYQSGAEDDSSEVIDLREVIADVNIINPEFVLLTGDLINEGELEDYLGWRVYTRSQALLREFDVPVFLTAGNHDVGGWSDTPPSDGTARRDWWRFFGWKRLNDPPAGAPWYTQNYSFDYGPVHYIGLEAYINYDGWRSYIYGGESFTSGQLDWLDDEMASSSGSAAQVLFYHMDFADQINLNALGAEMALWGHIHRDEGSIYSQPYDLATNNVCDGERAYRLIRVSSGALQPRPTLSAGSSGSKLEVEYVPANDGGHDEVTAEITNDFSESFEHAQLKFRMPGGAIGAQVTGGTLVQVDDSDSMDVYYVAVDIQSNSFQQVTVTLDWTGVADGSAETGRPNLWLAQNHPNPFNPETALRYGLPGPAHVHLAIYDVHGRRIAVLTDGVLPAGEHRAAWNGRTAQGQPAAPGVYLARLTADGEVRTCKIVLAR